MRLFSADYSDPERPIHDVHCLCPDDQPLGSAYVVGRWPGADPYQGVRVAGLLRHLGSRSVPYRVPVKLETHEIGEAVECLNERVQAARLDPAWFSVDLIDGGTVVGVTEDQAYCVARRFGVQCVILRNGQTVRALVPNPDGRAVEIQDRYGRQPFKAHRCRETPDGWVLQTYPSGEFEGEA